MLIGKINTSMWFHCMKKEEDQPDKRKDKAQKAHTHQNVTGEAGRQADK